MTARRPDLVVMGDALLDVDVHGTVDRLCPDAPVPVLDETGSRARPGGAALAATLAARHGTCTTLVTGLGEDEGGVALRELLGRAGVQVIDIGLSGPTPQKVRLRCDGQSLVRVDRGGPSSIYGTDLDPALRALAGASGVLVADYGRGLAAVEELRRALEGLAAPVVWDPHPRGPRPTSGTAVATPSRAELLALTEPGHGTATDVTGADLSDITERAAALARRWQVGTIAVTRGAEGVVLSRAGCAPVVVPTRGVDAHDACGAGDAFAAALTAGLASGHLVSEAVEAAAAAATAFVDEGGAASVDLSTPERPGSGRVPTMVHSAPPSDQSRGRTVVASGGCFDLLHAGHVALLQAAAGLGDRLVVLLNSDRSVRRLKGPDRPLQTEADRRAVLLALGCVDEVVVFDEDTPAAALDRLRPDLFVKGGDYAGVDLPEAAVLDRWGGHVVLVPYLDGRSTTGILQEARRAI